MTESRRPTDAEKPGNTATRASIVIPTRNRPGDLRRCLESLAVLDERPELIVVDQSDSRGEGTGRPIPTVDTYLRPPTVGKSAALNDGIRAATGAIIGFTDDDCSVPPDWLSRALTWFDANPGLGIVCGPARATKHDPQTEFVPEFVATRRTLRSGRLATRHIGALGGNMLVRRSVFDAVGLFDELLGPGARYHSAEDQDLNNRALRAGFSVLYDPVLSVTHWGARSYAHGQAARLLRGYSLGIGALAAKSLRTGDLPGSYPFVRELGAELRSLGRSCFGGQRREPFVLRSPWLVAGLARGLVQPLDRTRGVFTVHR